MRATPIVERQRAFQNSELDETVSSPAVQANGMSRLAQTASNSGGRGCLMSLLRAGFEIVV
jgi:hypothetical protein